MNRMTHPLLNKPCDIRTKGLFNYRPSPEKIQNPHTYQTAPFAFLLVEYYLAYVILRLVRFHYSEFKIPFKKEDMNYLETF